VIWLLRHLKPDFKTIADFRRDNRKAFRPVFRQFVLLCRQLDLFGRELLAVDGTRIKAVNNKDRNFTRASLASSSNWPTPSSTITCSGSTRAMRRSGNGRLAGREPGREDRRDPRAAHALPGDAGELDRTGESQISLTDPDSRAMAAHTRVAVGYNVQVAVDTKHKLIVEQQVTNQVLDMGLLTADRRTGEGDPRRRDDRRRRRQGLLQDRGYRGLREGRHGALCAASAARSLRSGQACSARMSFATTRQRQLPVRPVSG
jgi:hypothetical protein